MAWTVPWQAFPCARCTGSTMRCAAANCRRPSFGSLFYCSMDVTILTAVQLPSFSSLAFSDTTFTVRTLHATLFMHLFSSHRHFFWLPFFPATIPTLFFHVPAPHLTLVSPTPPRLHCGCHTAARRLQPARDGCCIPAPHTVLC